MKDPIVENIREIREKHANRFNNDLHSIFNDIMEHQQQYSNRLVRLKSQRLGSKIYKNKSTVNHMISEKESEYNSKIEGKSIEE